MPPAQTVLWLILAGLALDAHSTWACLRRGHRETNLLLRKATPTGILRASGWLALIMLAAFAAALVLPHVAALPPREGRAYSTNILGTLVVVSLTKIIAGLENYLLLFTGRDLASRIFGRLVKRGHVITDILAALLLAVVPGFLLATWLFPQLVHY